MPRKTKTKYSSKKTSKSVVRHFHIRWSAVLLAIFVAAAGWFLIYSSYHQHIEAGQYNISDTYIGENLGQSLDLKLAAKASYPSDPLTVFKDLGSQDNLTKKEISFDVKSDGLTEYGLMVLPATPKPANGYPVIILLHGFASPVDYLTDRAYLQDMVFYAQHGFAVIKPDYRGQGLSAAVGHPDSAYYSMAYNTDVMSLISAVKQTSYFDKSNLNLWGHSLGAYIALRAAVLSKDIKNLILLSGPVDSLSKMYLTYIPPSDSRDPYALATRSEVFAKYHTPANNDRFWYDASPINFVSQIKARIQIHVGTNDRTVPPEFSADLDAALTKNYVPHQYFVYADGGHGLTTQRPLIWARSLNLLLGSSRAG